MPALYKTVLQKNIKESERHQLTGLCVFMRIVRILRIINVKIRMLCIMRISCVFQAYFCVKFTMSATLRMMNILFHLCVFHVYDA
jgi:hypothetical protein